MKANRRYLILLFWLGLFSAFGQKAPLKYGKISDREKEVQVCYYDSSAAALILYDYGTITMGYGQPMVHTRHKRVKIFNEGGLDQATISIPYYSHQGSEYLKKLKAQTINVTKDGKTVKKEVEKGQIFKKKINEYWSEMVFTFPAVEEGSIIEYSYAHFSESITNLKKWYFQDKIPTLHSELRIFVQEGLDYRSLMKGGRLFKKYGNEETFDSWVLQNLPALKDEPFCANYYDFAERVQFQLAGYYTRSSDIHGTREYVKLMNTWPKMVKDILSTNNYQGYLGKKGVAKKILKTILDGEESEEEVLDKIYHYMINEFNWDGDHHLFRDQKLSNFLKTKKGNSAELNLFFVSLLKNAGLETHPAIISTKDHGFVSKVYPLRSQFNHVVAAVKLNQQYELYDVVDPNHPMSLLPIDDLNYNALLLESKADTANWLNIPKPKRSKKILIVDIDYSQGAQINGKVQLSTTRYESVLQRARYKRAGDDNSFIREYMLEDERFEIEKVEIENVNDVDRSFKLACNFHAIKEDLEMGDFIYIDPYLSKINEHPFKAKERNTPIDFYYPQTDLYLCNVIIPPGYEIEELPESKNLALPNREIVLKSSSKILGNKIQILLDLSISKPLISKEEYGAIQEIFDHYFSKQDQQIVLKKKKE